MPQPKILLTNQYRYLHIFVVGLGGTGSWLAPHVARLATLSHYPVSLTFIDHDTVELKNTKRQNFIQAEIGRPKATTLAHRYSAAYGLEIKAICQPFQLSHVPQVSLEEQVILIGCVDNHIARLSLTQVVDRNSPQRLANHIYLDSGNHKEHGQVLLGTTNNLRSLKKAFHPHLQDSCIHIPSPGLQHPELLKPEKKVSVQPLSCADLALADAQGLTVNQRAAAEVSDFLMRLILTKDLQRFATYFNLPLGTAFSRSITPEEIALSIRRNPSQFFNQSTRAQRSRKSTVTTIPRT